MNRAPAKPAPKSLAELLRSNLNVLQYGRYLAAQQKAVTRG